MQTKKANKIKTVTTTKINSRALQKGKLTDDQKNKIIDRTTTKIKYTSTMVAGILLQGLHRLYVDINEQTTEYGTNHKTYKVGKITKHNIVIVQRLQDSSDRQNVKFLSKLNITILTRTDKEKEDNTQNSCMTNVTQKQY